MKKSQLRQIIKEEISRTLKESDMSTRHGRTNPYGQWKNRQPAGELNVVKSVIKTLRNNQFAEFMAFLKDEFPLKKNLDDMEAFDEMLEYQYKHKDHQEDPQRPVQTGWSAITDKLRSMKTLREASKA